MSGCAALVLAAGRGDRLGGETAKQYLPLGGRAVLRHSVDAFAADPGIGLVRVVIRAEDRASCDRALEGLDRRRVLAPAIGGASRQDSARIGLESLAQEAPDRVLIHDAARPFVTPGLIGRLLAALDRRAAAIPAVAVRDTLKRSDGGGGLAAETLDRAGLWRAQTPQAFRFADILRAHREAAGRALTDDAAVAEQAGIEVALVAGGEDNFKITTAEDMERARRAVGAPPGEIRVGTGFDAHRFAAGDRVTLCGVEIPCDRGLEGHSDADAGLHAVTDAVLGAMAAGDIGMHFPPSDPRWRGASSARFLQDAAARLARRAGEIVHVDLTLICERPRIGPHRDAMAERLAGILGIARGRVGVKATTTDGLGFAGRGEGVAAQAVATIRLPG